MVPVITGVLFSVGFLVAYFVFNPPDKRSKTQEKVEKFSLAKRLRLDKYQDEAEKIGWFLSKRDILIIIGLAAVVSLILSAVTSNIFVLVAGVIAGLYLPKFLIQKKRQMNRMTIINQLVGPLRMLISRLPDQQNVTKAIELTRDETLDVVIRDLFNEYLSYASIEGNVRDALLLIKKKVNIKKFDVFIDHLIQAHYEGFTQEAMRALEKSVEAIEFDLRAIDKVKIQSKTKKQKLYTSLGVAWLFPVILSFVNTGNTNVFLNTLPGKIHISLSFVCTIFVYVKGEEYLSLNLDEL